ncbi:MAG: hypothetical protein H7177_11075 [Rhizobacter sp.]|nr:hypothetical protein [Bacteriovorax sp.]
MKAILFTIITVTIFYSAIQTDKIKTVEIYQGNAIDQLDPSWPKMA